jgi:multiple sugar transport system ATP-binding protein
VAEVVLKRVKKSFKGHEVIHGVDLDIHDREFVVFVGPSGCGKSTLLRMVAGLEDVTAGDVLIDGKRVNDRLPSERGIAMVFQSYALYPHMTVYENMAFGLKLAKTGKQEVEKRVREAARILQIEDLLGRRPRELSGGQRQRVAIGRAITREPKVFLFDEPLSNLDAALRVQMRLEIARLKDAVAATMIYVTHDQVEAMTLADRIVVLNAGRVEQVGGPLELYEHPRNLFVAGFIGSPRMNLLPATVEAVAPSGAISLRLKGGTPVAVPATGDPAPAAGTEVTLGVRPEHVSAARRTGAPIDGRMPGKVLVVEQLGAESFLYVRTEAGDTVVARSDPAAHPVPDDAVELAVQVAQCHVFGPDGIAYPRMQAR